MNKRNILTLDHKMEEMQNFQSNETSVLPKKIHKSQHISNSSDNLPL